MPSSWAINTGWESLENGTPEEMAGFAALGIQVKGIWLTEGHDKLLQSLRRKPLLSTYHLAEWLAWNWWRLRWEPSRATVEWGLAHRMSSIGGGYVWPNIEFVSDGQQVSITSKPTPDRSGTPFRYIVESNALIQDSDFETVIDDFIDRVIQRLHDRSIFNSNLETVWESVLHERRHTDIAQRRKLEALLGEEPDPLHDELLGGLIQDAKHIGLAAMEEIAANRMGKMDLPHAADLLDIEKKHGFDFSLASRINLKGHDRESSAQPYMAAWQLGTQTANALRKQEHLGGRPVRNKELADMFGTSEKALENFAEPKSDLDLSFALNTNGVTGGVVLRSKWVSGRRFELARLLGDQLIYSIHEPLRPATRTHTFRQKVQRAFAAELLSPFEEVNVLLDGDYSMEKQMDVAQHFQVSELTIRTSLVNHARIDRTALDGDAPGLHFA